MTLYKVHFEDGEKVEIDAETPKGASEQALQGRPSSRIAKIKVVRGS